MAIEPATAEDLDDLVDAWVDLASTQRRHGSHLGAAANRETVRPLLAHHVVRGTVLVARRGGQEGDGVGDGGGPNDVIGFANFGLEEGALESDATRGVVHNLYVQRAFRGKGVGSELLAAAEAALRARGADVIAIEALWENEGARRLYRRRGYEPHRVQFERTAGDGPDEEPTGDDAREETGKGDDAREETGKGDDARDETGKGDDAREETGRSDTHTKDGV